MNSPVDATLRHALRSKMAVIRPSSEQFLLICLEARSRTRTDSPRETAQGEGFRCTTYHEENGSFRTLHSQGGSSGGNP